MIEEYSGLCEDTMGKLLDVYQMTNWDMSWQDFLIQFSYEMLNAINEWKNEKINEE